MLDNAELYLGVGGLVWVAGQVILWRSRYANGEPEKPLACVDCRWFSVPGEICSNPRFAEYDLVTGQRIETRAILFRNQGPCFTSGIYFDAKQPKDD